MRPIRLSRQKWREIVETRAVRAALEAKGRQVESRTNQIATSEGVDLDLETSHGTRPKGRSYFRVAAPDGANQEWGTRYTERRRILGRAADSA